MAEIKLPSNSISSKSSEPNKTAPEKKFTKITTGKVTVKKKTGLEKFAETFFEDDIRNVMRTIKNEMLIPAVKNIAVNAINSAVSMMIFGKDVRPNYNGYTNFYQPTQNQANASWTRYYTRNQAPYPSPNPSASGYSGGPNVSFSLRRDAEVILDQMREAIATFGKVSLGDYYDLLGITTDYTDFSYGWYDLTTATIRPSGSEFIIVFPKAIPLGR